MFSESWNPGCSGDAWHQSGLVVQVVGITCGQLQRKFRVGDPVGTILLGSWKGKLYTLRGEHVYLRSEWLSDSGIEDEREIVVVPTIQFLEESSSLLSIGKRLSQYVRAEQGEEEEASLEFRVVFRSRNQISKPEGVALAKDSGLDVDKRPKCQKDLSR